MKLSLLLRYKLAIAFPANQPLVQQCWKLNPPVIPSTSNTSPAKYNPLHIKLSIVLKLTSSNETPPDITNSSKKALYL